MNILWLCFYWTKSFDVLQVVTVNATELSLRISSHVGYNMDKRTLFENGPNFELNCDKTLYRSCMFLKLRLRAKNGPSVTLKKWSDPWLLLQLQLVKTCCCKWWTGPLCNKEAIIIIQSWTMRKCLTSRGSERLHWLCKAVNCILFLMLKC